MNNWKILIIDDELSIRKSFQKFLKKEGYIVETAENGYEGLDLILSFKPHSVLLDINMPGMTGLELLEKLKSKDNFEMPIIITITAYGDMSSAIKATQFGAFDFLSKPITLTNLRTTIAKGLERISTTETIAFEIEKNTAVSDSLIGNSPQMVEIYKSIAMLSHNKATVLITGESGTGKELVARAVHNMSMAKEEPFIALNCAAIHENLIESELMGYVKGSFTGAEKTKLGKLDIVGEGSLLLDEIAETPLEFQSKLLRLLQEREYYPIGSNVSKIFKGRIIAATNKNLKKAVEEKKFREDLYYRLNVVTIQIPPLKKHISDLEILIKHFIQKANKSMNTDISEITQESIELLKQHSWPGNIRELENAIIKAVISTKGKTLTKDSFSFLYKKEKNLKAVFSLSSSNFEFKSLKEIEKEYIDFVLKNFDWHKGKSATILGITRPTLDKKIEEYKLIKNA